MIPYLGCDAARSMLEPFVDAELPVAEQVALEVHLRWCDTCRARVEDLQLIGAALRVGSAASTLIPQDAAALEAMESEVLARIDAERDQSLGVRCRELLTMRFLWPALGASLALVICVCAVTVVSGVVRAERPDSMAALLSGLASAGSDHSPLKLAPHAARLDPRLPAPRALPVRPVISSIREGDAVFLLSAVVTREGRVATYELLRSAREPSDEVSALVDALKYSRFAPAQTAEGAVNVVWLLAHTTVKAPAAPEHLEKSLSDGLARPVLRPARS
jgi:hypothetical protein